MASSDKASKAQAPKIEGAEREKKLAEALRANLRRRKAERPEPQKPSRDESS
jgi:hypothetical protein